MGEIIGAVILAVFVAWGTWQYAGAELVRIYRARWRERQIARIKRQLAAPRAAGDRLRPYPRTRVDAQVRYLARVAVVRGVQKGKYGLVGLKGERL